MNGNSFVTYSLISEQKPEVYQLNKSKYEATL